MREGLHLQDLRTLPKATLRCLIITTMVSGLKVCFYLPYGGGLSMSCGCGGVSRSLRPCRCCPGATCDPGGMAARQHKCLSYQAVWWGLGL